MSEKQMTKEVNAPLRIYKVAERYGLNCIDVLRFPNIARKTKLPEGALTPSAAHAAESIRRDRMRSLQDRITARNAAILQRRGDLPEPENIAGDAALGAQNRKSGRPGAGKARETLEGQPVTAVIRWLGKEGWSFDQAKAALVGVGLNPADGTIRAQLTAGKKGQRGEPARLSDKMVDKLNSLKPTE